MLNRKNAGLSEFKTQLTHCLLKLGCECIVSFPVIPDGDGEEFVASTDTGMKKKTRWNRLPHQRSCRTRLFERDSVGEPCNGVTFIPRSTA